MSVRPIASFATAANAAMAANALNPPPPPASFAGGFGETNINSGVPRAVIPPMEELGVGSGVGSDYASGTGFDLTSAPMQPVPQRFTFEPGSSLGGNGIAGVADVSLTSRTKLGRKSVTA